MSYSWARTNGLGEYESICFAAEWVASGDSQTEAGSPEEHQEEEDFIGAYSALLEKSRLERSRMQAKPLEESVWAGISQHGDFTEADIAALNEAAGDVSEEESVPAAEEDPFEGYYFYEPPPPAEGEVDDFG